LPQPLQAVFFDVDGVLIDSLPEHLQICRDKAAEFGLKLTIPTIEEFRRVHDMLKSLRDSGLRIGLVTSNLCANIKPALGDAMQYFEPSCVFCWKGFPEPPTEKAFSLTKGARLLQIDPSTCLYAFWVLPTVGGSLKQTPSSRQ
jgi:phosphoglycolate phosphatase-like HAD superfamily hydrolase